jgi:UDP-N-acetylmuramoyl-tripeptide--D-alanyl-D-alanine ligase
VNLRSSKLKEYFLAQEIVAENLPEFINLHLVIDSRLVKQGDVFGCLHGERTDGHNHISDAIQNGAIGFITDRFVDISKNYFQIITTSAENAIKNAASQILKETNVKQIAITGSAGKTTTKEIVFSLFNPFWKTGKTQGNYNTPIGVPVSIINANREDNFFICELSASYPGEIDHNLSFMSLEAAIITGIGSSHLEFFGSIENIFSEKMKIAKSIRNKGPLLINGDQDWGWKAKLIYPNTLSFGLKNGNDIQALSIQKTKQGTSFKVKIKEKYISDFTLNTFGDHFVYDSLPGIYLSFIEGIPISDTRLALFSFQAEKGRGKLIPWIKNSTIIDESYNANPYSFSMSIQSFQSSNFSRKIAIIGDMLELGPDADKLHFELGEMIRKSDIKAVIYKGEFNGVVQKALGNSGIQFYASDSIFTIQQILCSIVKSGDGILIKASNGVGLHQLVKELESKQ